MLNQDVQKKAQAELDAVLGHRLPTMADRPNLPYVDAILKETSRWHLLGPFGAPHMLDTDDVYNGFFIPKGTIILPNMGCVLSLTFIPTSLGAHRSFILELSPPTLPFTLSPRSSSLSVTWVISLNSTPPSITSALVDGAFALKSPLLRLRKLTRRPQGLPWQGLGTG